MFTGTLNDRFLINQSARSISVFIKVDKRAVSNVVRAV